MWRDHGMGHITMEAARRCEIVANDTPALDADKAARLTRFVERMYVCAGARTFSVYLDFYL